MAGEGEEQTGTDNGSESNEALSGLQAKFDDLQTKNEEMSATNASLSARQGQLEDSLLDPAFLAFKEEQGRQTTTPTPETGDAAPDWDTMSQADMATHLTKARGDAISTMKEELDKSKSEIKEAFGQMFAHFDLAMTRSKYPDFDVALSDKATNEKFYTLAKENPAWNADQLRKYMHMQSQVEALEKTNADKERAAEQHKAMMEKGVTPGAAVIPADMTPQQAGEAGFREGFGSSGDVDELG